jgi:hypothetical protein
MPSPPPNKIAGPAKIGGLETFQGFSPREFFAFPAHPCGSFTGRVNGRRLDRRSISLILIYSNMADLSIFLKHPLCDRFPGRALPL